jgi:glycosyltransferase involved in cell wall biosynthesis
MSGVSVIIPVRDGEAHIAEAVTSALCQGPKVIEVIVVDDGSRDASASIVRAIADPRIKILETGPEGGRGVSAARNFGFAASHGQWVMFLDADDRLRPGAIAGLLETAEGQNAVAIYGDYERIDGAGRSKGRRGAIRGRQKPSGDILRAILAGNMIVNGGIMIIDRATFADLGGFDQTLRYCEDWHAWCRVAARGQILYRPGAHILDYRVHGDSTMMSRIHVLDDYRPALDAIFADKEIRAAIPGEELATLKHRATNHLSDYLLGQAARARRFDVVLSGLGARLLHNPKRFPRTLALCAAAIAGF